MNELRVGIVVASLGRPEVIGTVLAHLQQQTLTPSRIVLSVTSDSDIPPEGLRGVTVVYGPKGSCAQRNRGLAEILDSCDLVCFFDDDYLPSRYALEGIVRLFETFPDIVGANGLLLADGINSPGITYDDAVALLEDYDRAPREAPAIVKCLPGLYGCNMVFRASHIGSVRFDETLPLYAWLEDVDFAARVGAQGGRLVATQAFAGVHRGVKSGRTSGVRFGYSQIANPLYLIRKGTMGTASAAQLMSRNLMANHVRALWPEAWVDRKGRAKGNWLALWHLMTGRLDPSHIVRL